MENEIAFNENDLTIDKAAKLVLFTFFVLHKAYRKSSQGRHGCIDMLLGKHGWGNNVLELKS